VIALLDEHVAGGVDQLRPPCLSGHTRGRPVETHGRKPSPALTRSRRRHSGGEA
jgi:hypothetical protein